MLPADHGGWRVRIVRRRRETARALALVGGAFGVVLTCSYVFTTIYVSAVGLPGGPRPNIILRAGFLVFILGAPVLLGWLLGKGLRGWMIPLLLALSWMTCGVTATHLGW
jgi:hypothetical protein